MGAPCIGGGRDQNKFRVDNRWRGRRGVDLVGPGRDTLHLLYVSPVRFLAFADRGLMRGRGRKVGGYVW
jgi:hypothetical protein